MYPKFGISKLSENDIKRIRSMGSREILQYFDVPVIEVPMIIVKIRRKIEATHIKIMPFKGMIELIKELKALGFSCGILTSNSQSIVAKFLRENSLENYFEFIESDANIFSKSGRMRKIVKRYDLNEKSIYIGDEVRDVQAANRSNIQSIAVTWGFGGVVALRQSNPNKIIEKPNQLLKAIEELS
jgi:phosphoglycolate phosphatase